MVCLFLLYNKVNQLYVYIYPHISSLLRLLYDSSDLANSRVLGALCQKLGTKTKGLFLIINNNIKELN